MEVTPRGHVQGDCQGGRRSNGNGGRRVEDGEGDWASPPLQASTRRAQPRLRKEVADLGGDSAKRKVEVIREREEVREGWKAEGHTRKRHPRRGPDCVKAPVPGLACSVRLTVAVFIEIFSGVGNLAKAVARETGWPTLLWDITLGSEYDLRNASKRRMLGEWIKSGAVKGFHLSTPCESFSRARDRPPGPPPLRSDKQPLGLGFLKPHDEVKVLLGNQMMHFSAWLLNLALRFHIPASMENPARSRIWLCPPLLALRRRRRVSWHVTHNCAWGKAFKKPTAFLAARLNLHRLDTAVCIGAKRGFCWFTGNTHIPLCGQDEHGNWLTKLAQTYPARMRTAIAKCFKDTDVEQIARQFERHVNASSA